MYTCPSCGFKTREESSFGSHDICKICGREDDAVQLSNPLSGGGANVLSLYESQILFNLQNKGTSNYDRDIFWRKLNELEILDALMLKMNKKIWSNNGCFIYDDVYWLCD